MVDPRVQGYSVLHSKTLLCGSFIAGRMGAHETHEVNKSYKSQEAETQRIPKTPPLSNCCREERLKLGMLPTGCAENSRLTQLSEASPMMRSSPMMPWACLIQLP